MLHLELKSYLVSDSLLYFWKNIRRLCNLLFTFRILDDIPIQDPHQSESADGLGAISEEKEDNNNTPEIHPRRSLPKMAASFGKKTKEKIAIAVKSGSVSSIKSTLTDFWCRYNLELFWSRTNERGSRTGYYFVLNFFLVFFLGVTKSNSILLNGGDASETDESGIELGGSDISNLAMQENDNSSTPYNNRKNPQITNTLDMDVSRSMQVSSV